MLIAPYGQREQIAAETSLLIVEDNPEIRQQLQDWFEAEYKLTFAATGAEALSALRRQRVDLVLLESTTPQVDSIDVLLALRAEHSSTELPVIMITALSDADAAVRGLQLGANDYVTKPLDADITRARISTQIALKNAVDDRQQMISQLKFTQEMQENFSRIVSHDLKGPLTNIRMAQFMLRDILRENSEASSILDNMDATLNGMVDMVRMFLDAMDSQQLEPNLERLEVHDLLVELADQYH
ncbi:MAG: response regulator, partial [Chloroflexota bacterium]